MRRSTCNRLPGVSRFTEPTPSIPEFITTSFVQPRANLSGDRATSQLAEDMRQAGNREGGVSREDLQLLGWTGAQLDLLGEKARIRAQRLSGGSI
jgi:hypothetical protein